MRPARKGPENLEIQGGFVYADRNFNEAGPQGAGKPDERYARPDDTDGTSMRPARKGPENHAGSERQDVG